MLIEKSTVNDHSLMRGFQYIEKKTKQRTENPGCRGVNVNQNYSSEPKLTRPTYI